MTDLPEEDEKFVRYDTHRWEHDWHVVRDMGIRRVIGLETLETFSAIRRFIWRSDEKGHPDIIAARMRGQVISIKSQKHIATYTGRSYKNTKKDIALLKALGWLRIEKINEQWLHANVVGFLAREPGVPFDWQHADEILFADLWMRRLWTAMNKHFVDDVGIPFKASTFEQRREFCESYVAPMINRAALRLVGGDE